MLRSATIGAGALLLISIAAPAQALPAQAATAPTAPYNALVLDGRQGSFLLNGTLALDSGNATLSASPWGTNGIELSASNASHTWQVMVVPPQGSTWSVGTTYTLTRGVPNSTDAFFSVGGDGRGCDDEPGSLTVREATTDSSNKLTAFAATFTVGCENVPSVLSGEMRWNSSIGYTGATTSAGTVDFGDLPATIAGPAKTVTYTAAGSDPVTFGTAAISGANSGAFSVSGDTCSSATLNYGQTCAISVVPKPTAVGAQSAALILPDNTASGQKYVALTVTGTDPRSVSLSSTYLDFGRQDIGVTGAAKVLTVTATGPQPVTFTKASIGGSSASSFSITADKCSGTTLSVGSSCAITVTPHAAAGGPLSATLAIPGNLLTSIAEPLYATGIVGAEGTFYPLAPTRILDTRTGLGASKAAVGAGGTVHLQVLGRGGVPATGVSAVVLNVTVTGASQSSYLTVYPDGATRPTASSLNFPRDWTGANSVTAKVGSNGKVGIYNAAGSTQVIADVVGYYGGDDSLIDSGYGVGGQFQRVQPQRIFDSRRDWGEKLPADYYVNVPVDYGSDVNPHIRALIVNVTANEPDSNGYLATWNGLLEAFPSTSTLNFVKGKTVPNLAVVPTAACEDCGSATGLPSIGVYSSANTHVLVDIVGFYDDGTLPDGMRYNPITPTRIVDSRIGLGTPNAFGPNTTRKITTPSSLLTASDTGALALNVTADEPTQNTYLEVWPDGVSQPVVSNLNPAQGQIVPNAVDTLLGSNKAFDVFNAAGTINVIIDVDGTFYFYPGTTSNVTAAARTQGTQGNQPRRLATTSTPVIHKAN